MKKIIKFIQCFLFIVLINTASFAAGEIGVVDNVRIMNEFPAAQAAKRKLASLQGELEKQMGELKQQLDKDLQAAKTDKEKSEKQKIAIGKFEAEKARFESLVESIRKDIDDAIEKAIKDVAQAQSLSMVVSNSVVYYGGKDITNDVLNKLK